jgi:hypothetical protein
VPTDYYATAVGRVRLLAADTSDDPNEVLLDDEQIEAILDIEGGNIRRAGALAIETIATDQALVLKVIRTLDLQTDGAKVAEVLLKRAALLRGQADDDADDPDDDFAIAEFADPVCGWREVMHRQFQRAV